jgi:hypothetical protein
MASTQDEVLLQITSCIRNFHFFLPALVTFASFWLLMLFEARKRTLHVQGHVTEGVLGNAIPL